VELNLHFPIRYCNVVINYAQVQFYVYVLSYECNKLLFIAVFTERVQKTQFFMSLKNYN